MRGLVLFAAALQVALVRGCSDTSTDCSYYKEAGYCESYGDTLKEMCAKTCGFCGGTGGGGDAGDPGTAVDPRPARKPESMDLCRDTCSTKDCEWYKGQGHCEKYSAVMTMNCASTCQWCGARLCTPPDVENGWTDFEMIMIPAGATVNVYCYEGFKNMGSAQLTCNSYGEIDGSARCEEIVKDDSGYPGTQETACQRAAKSAMEPSYANGQYVVPQMSTHYVPQCDDYNGNYKEIQYDGSKGETFCVDMYRGTEVQGTRIQGQHEYISCAPGAAKEYYDRLAQENAASSSSSSGSSYDYSYDGSASNYDYTYNDNSGSSYNYDTSGGSSYDYDTTGGSSYEYNYDTSGGSSYDYNYDTSGGSSYDYGYDNSGSSSAGEYTSGSGGEDYYASGGDYSSGNDNYYAGDSGAYYGGNDDGYYASGDDYASSSDGYYAGSDDYASSSDGYYAGSDDYASSSDGYYAGSDDYASGSDGYYAGSGDDYASSDDGYYSDGYSAGGDGFSSGEDGYGDDGYYASVDGFDNSYYYADDGSPDGTQEVVVEEDAAEVSYRKVAVAEDAEDAVAEEEEDSVEEVTSTKDATRRRARKNKRRNKREADAQPADE